MKIRVTVLSLLFIMFWHVGNSIAQDDLKLYKKARKYTYKKEWDKAIKSYRKLGEKYPDSRYVDDSQFWKAYILENRGSSKEAFMEYQYLITQYPNSPWVDDALIHQITIAEALYQRGENRYREFLENMMSSEIKNVRYQAALSSGKIGQRNALPILKEIANNGDGDLRILAESLILKLNTPNAVAEKKGQSDMNEKDNRQESQDKSSNKNVLKNIFSSSSRMELYEKLNKEGDTWTELELITYGLWHVLPEAEFNDFIVLQNDYDKNEWLRKFWKRWDPTPTTTENERKDEFLRRIHYAHSEFGAEWNYRRSTYLKKQYLRDGWSMAPWDSRGELYIKYGEPEFRDVSKAFKKEIWNYYRYNVDFVVFPYTTNIYGYGIEPGPISKRIYKDYYRSYIETDFIYKPDFRFEPYRNFEPFKDFEIDVVVAKDVNDKDEIKIVFELSGKELYFYKEGLKYRAELNRNYIVFDEDYNEILSDSEQIEIVSNSKKEATENHKKEFNFIMDSPRGYYTVAIRIEDANSKKIGIFMKEFELD